MKHIAEILQWRAGQADPRAAYTFLQGEEPDAEITYRQLHEAAQRIGAYLQRQTKPGDRVILLYPPGLDFICGLFGCFYSGRIAVPAYPPALGRSGRNLKRLQSILSDARPSAALCNSKVMAHAGALAEAGAAWRELQWINTDDRSELAEPGNAPSPLSAEQVAFLQYTSGSTAEPKGVRVTHANLMHNLQAIGEAFGHSSESRGVIWLPPYHDMGLIGGILQPLYAGFPVTLMSPASFLQKPFLWLQTISRRRGTTSGGPGSAYELCVTRISEEQKAELDLSSWNVAFNGSEPVRLETIDAFARAFASCGFRRSAFLSCYGLAEATLMVSGFRSADAPVQSIHVAKESLEAGRIEPAAPGTGRALVGCGSTKPPTEIRIIDAKTRLPVADGDIGEIWVSGPGIADGYWEKPELSRDVFAATLADAAGTGTFLRTGDLGFLHGGSLYVTGRIKDLIIIRGLNFYPQDIEAVAADSHDQVRGAPAAAFAVDSDGEERLVIAQEVDRHCRPEHTAEIIRAIRAAVSREFQLVVHVVALVKTGHLPKTSSGKIQRHLCRDLFLKRQLDVVAVDTAVTDPGFAGGIAPDLEGLDEEQRVAAVEEYLRQCLGRVLKVDAAALSGELGFYEAGFDSLMIMDLQHRIEMDFHIELPPGQLLETENLTQLAREIARRIATSPAASAPDDVAAPAEYPLSYGQKALWFLHQLAPNDSAYNVAATAQMLGEVDVEALSGAFADVLQRHSALRVRFAEKNGEPIQSPRPAAGTVLVLKNVAGWTKEAVEREIHDTVSAPFDLRNDGPVRAVLFQGGPREYLLCWVTHHIVTDFWSFSLLWPELEAFYLARKSGQPAELPEPAAQYWQYVRWEDRLLKSAEGERLRNFWKHRITAIPHLTFPPRRPGTAGQRGGAEVAWEFPPDLVAPLRDLAVREQVTLNELLLAAFAVLLFRHTGEEEIVIGTPASGRSAKQFRDVVGYCVNPLLLRIFLDANLGFSAFCGEVKRGLREALRHQGFPLALVFEELRQTRGGTDAAGVQVMFAFNKAERLGKAAPFLFDEPGAKLNWGDLTLEPHPARANAAQFELMLNVCESKDKIRAAWQYRTDVFDRDTIEALGRRFQKLLRGIVAAPALPFSQVPLLDRAEAAALARSGCAPRRAYPPAEALHRLIEAQAERRPDAIAVACEGTELTYRQLNARANQVARGLRSAGVKPEVIVPVCMERSPELIVSLLAILKAGGAYLPLDPGDPVERVTKILSEINAPVLLTQKRFAGRLESAARTWCVDEWQWDGESPENLPGGAGPKNMAYVIYTSGSTGAPKGAINTHEGICNRLQWMQEAYGLDETDRVLQKTPYTFDVSVWEFFWPLISGARLVFARPDGHRDPVYLAGLIREARITTLHFVPSMLQVFLEEREVERCVDVKRVICSGEALPYELTRRFYQRLPAALHNLYGPTEASVDVTYWPCPRETSDHTVPIGKPIANVEVYVLDAQLDPVPEGVTGEIYLAGIGLGRGYFARPDLTADRFVPCPFGPPGARMYRTGDRGRFLPDGNVEYLGRTDHQVKIRGFRIELGEIENRLGEHPAVRDCVVVAREDHGREKQLVAYFVSRTESPPPAHELRSHLSGRLPDYMVPAVFIALEAIPLSPNGKADRKALPAPEPGRAELEAQYTAPRTDTERTLVGILEETLRRKPVGIHDNFFQLGGNSLLMTRIVSRIRDSFSVDVPMAKFFQGPTVAQLAEVVVQQKVEQQSADEISALLDQLEHLSAEEVELRLKQVGVPENDPAAEGK